MNDLKQEQKENPPPLDPQVEKVRRKLMRFMLISTLLTMALIGVVLAAVIYKIVAQKRSATPPPNAALQKPLLQALPLQKGEKLLSQSLGAFPLLSLLVEDSKGHKRLVIYDYQKNLVLRILTFPDLF